MQPVGHRNLSVRMRLQNFDNRLEIPSQFLRQFFGRPR